MGAWPAAQGSVPREPGHSSHSELGPGNCAELVIHCPLPFPPGLGPSFSLILSEASTEERARVRAGTPSQRNFCTGLSCNFY